MRPPDRGGREASAQLVTLPVRGAPLCLRHLPPQGGERGTASYAYVTQGGGEGNGEFCICDAMGGEGNALRAGQAEASLGDDVSLQFVSSGSEGWHDCGEVAVLGGAVDWRSRVIVVELSVESHGVQ